jgi:predicted secreted Zn-dependent protease
MRRLLVTTAVLAWACGSSSNKPAVAPAPAAAPAAGGAAGNRTSIVSHEQYYDIDGASAGALLDQIHRLGPRDWSGRTANALTIWSIESSFAEAPSAAGCALRSIQVTLELTLTLPRWTPPSTAAPRLLESWRSYLQHLKLHEAGHRAIAERNARALAAALAGLRAPTCEELRVTASNTTERILADGRATNRAYDVETKNGQTQGVVLEP